MAAMKNYIVEPVLPNTNLTIGGEGGQTTVYLGQVAEFGGGRRVTFGATQGFVALLIGMRGSGKSFCLGSLLEGLCPTAEETSISRVVTRRGVLLLDPTGNFWPSLLPVRGDGPARVREQWQLFGGWGIQPEEVRVSVWVPAGFRRDSD